MTTTFQVSEKNQEISYSKPRAFCWCSMIDAVHFETTAQAQPLHLVTQQGRPTLTVKSNLKTMLNIITPSPNLLQVLFTRGQLQGRPSEGP